MGIFDYATSDAFQADTAHRFSRALLRPGARPGRLSATRTSRASSPRPSEESDARASRSWPASRETCVGSTTAGIVQQLFKDSLRHRQRRHDRRPSRSSRRASAPTGASTQSAPRRLRCRRPLLGRRPWGVFFSNSDSRRHRPLQGHPDGRQPRELTQEHLRPRETDRRFALDSRPRSLRDRFHRNDKSSGLRLAAAKLAILDRKLPRWIRCAHREVIQSCYNDKSLFITKRQPAAHDQGLRMAASA